MLNPANHLVKITPKIDVWEAGIILYELCMGNKPFYHDDKKILEEMIKKNDFPPLSKRISTSLKELITFMLGKDINLRPTIDQVLGSKIILE